MGIFSLLSAVGAAALSVSALAQDRPADAPAQESEPSSGLSDLSETVGDLSDEAPAQSPAEVPTPEPAVESSPAAASEAVATETSVPAVPMTAEEERSELALTASRGRQLFAVARAGLLATQDMLSRVADPEAAGISGWVAEPEGNAMAVTFYSNAEADPVAVYRARVLGGRVVSRDTFLTGTRPPLSGLPLRMARARSASESEDQRACTRQPFNVIAVPPANLEAPILVYRISPPESRSRLPFGGHFRSSVASDGSVSEARAFSRGCLNVDIGEVAPGTQAGPIAITHLLDPLPTEIHVFLSLFSSRPLVIAAGDPTRLFMVAGDAIREIRR